MGKGWSKGLNARTDGRVARAAAGHRGLQYRRRAAHQTMEWSPRLAYAVGLIATDGCLYGDGRHLAFTSKDEDLMRTLLCLVDRAHIRYRRFESEYGGWAFRGQFSHAALYRWLLTVGLMPRKSLVLGAIDVPDEHLLPLVRGLLDGDGTVYTLLHHPTPKTYRNYRYERLWTFFTLRKPEPRRVDPGAARLRAGNLRPHRGIEAKGARESDVSAQVRKSRFACVASRHLCGSDCSKAGT